MQIQSLFPEIQLTSEITERMPNITLVKSKNNKRTRTSALRDESICSRADRIAKRNKLLVARYYYWTELRRRRFDDVEAILADYEFFVDSQTISNAVMSNYDYFSELKKNKTTAKQLAKEYPTFSWVADLV